MSPSSNRLISAWQTVVKRLIAHWRLLSSVALGVLMATAIMSGAVVYFDALRELALKNALSQYPAARLDVLVRSQRGPTSLEEFEKVASAIRRAVDENLDWMLRDRIEAGKSPTFFLTQPGDEDAAGKDNARSYFAFFPRLHENGQYISMQPDGRLPGEEALSGPGEPLVLEAAIPLEAAQLFDLQVGDTMSAVPHWRDMTPYVRVVVSGIFSRNDPGDEMWYLETAVLNAATGPTFDTIPFFLSRKTYLEVLGPAFREMDSTYMWLLAVDASRLNARNADTTLRDVRQNHSAASSQLSSYGQTTALDNALVQYDRRLFFSKLPMYVVLVLIAFVVLFYVATLSSLVAEERRSEVALLRSRGSSTAQILAVFVLEGATIAVPAVLAGPVLAAWIIGMLGLTPAFSDLTGGALMETRVSSGAFMMSALAGALSFVSLIVPAVQASRIGVTRHRQQEARPSRLPVLQRYYVDVLLLLVSILLLRRLTEQGSVVATSVFGELAVNQLLLVLPGLVLLASALVLLRLFPLALSAFSRVASSGLPAGLLMGLWQMARNPTHYARLSLLLILAAGLGIFASSFGATLDRSFDERVRYATGSDIRLDGVRQVGLSRSSFSRNPVTQSVAPSFQDAFQRIEGVELASPVLRGRGTDLGKAMSENFEMLALDPESFPEVAEFRDDFSDKPMVDLLESLYVSNPPQGIELGEDTRAISVRLKADRAHPTVRVTLRLRDSQNHYLTHVLGYLDSSGWDVLRSGRSPTTIRSLTSGGPLTLVALRVEETVPAGRLLSGSILIDDISVTSGSGATRVVERFDSTSGWAVLMTTADAVADVLQPSDAPVDGGSGAALFSWTEGPSLTSRGIFHGTERSPLPVLASEAFVKASGYSKGREFDVAVAGYRVPVKVEDTVDFFPTMTSRNERFLIADLTSVIRYANLGAIVRELLPNEVWISTGADAAQSRQVVEAVENVEGFTNTFIHDRAALLAESNVDPLVQAGWRALLFVAFSTVLILSCLGFLFHAYVSFQNRRLQFALLRTVGLSPRQLTAMVWLEQTLVVVVGLALGTWMGGRLGAAIMPFMGHDDWGYRVFPPYALEVEWTTLLMTYAAMTFVFAVISLGVIWLVRRIALHRMLRLGEM